MSIRKNIQNLPESAFEFEGIKVRELRTEEDLGYDTVVLKLKPEQEKLVNPAGFSIGRALLNPNDNLPCIILKENEPIGFISFLKWHSEIYAYSWSYFIDRNYQGMGYGKKAAKLAIKILRAANPEIKINLAVEECNKEAQKLYKSIGFEETNELDGDDFIYSINNSKINWI